MAVTIDGNGGISGIAIDTSAITDGTIATADIADGAVTAAKLGALNLNVTNNAGSTVTISFSSGELDITTNGGSTVTVGLSA